MKPSTLLLIIIVTLIGCNESQKKVKTEDSVKLVMGDGIGGTVRASTLFAIPEAGFTAGGRSNRPGGISVNDPLPQSFLDREFMKNSVVAQRNIASAVGYIVVYDSIKKDYFKVTLKPVILGDTAILPSEDITDKVDYYSYVTAGGSVGASASGIASLKVETNNVAEIRLEDIQQCLVPDNRKDQKLLQAYINKIPKNDLSKYYFVEGAVLTNLVSKKYSSTKFSAKVDYSWVSIGGDTYGTKDKFLIERLVSLQLIRLDRMLTEPSLTPPDSNTVAKENQ